MNPRAILARVQRASREARIIALEAFGLAVCLTGVAQYSAPSALILGGVALVVAGELR